MSQETLEDLEKLVSEKPYFQGAHTLLAKGSKKLKSNKTAKRIATAAVYATDRVLLKKFINDELIFLTPLAVHDSHEADQETDIASPAKSKNIEPAESKEVPTVKEKAPQPKQATPEKSVPTAPSKPIPTPTQNQPSSPIEFTPRKSQGSDLDHLIDEVYRDLEELKINKAKLRAIENQLLEDEAVNEAVKRATADTQEKKESTKKKDSEKDETAVPKAKSTVKKVTPKKTASATKTTAKTKKSKSPSSTKSKAAESKKTVANKKVEPKTPSQKKKVAPRVSADDNNDRPDDVGEAVKEKVLEAKKRVSVPSSQDEIISEFIRANPSIPKHSKNESKKVQDDLSTHSTQLHPDVASEYLAEIYLEQGRVDRACQIYEALIVRFPEKSIYFADIIQKLNESS